MVSYELIGSLILNSGDTPVGSWALITIG